MGAKGGGDSAPNARITVFGPATLAVNGRLCPLRRLELRLLLALVRARGAFVDDDQLAEAVYYDRERKDVRSWRYLLRASLGEASPIVETVRSRGTRLMLDGSTGVFVAIDLFDFEREVAEVDRALASADLEGARRSAERALSVWEHSAVPFVELRDGHDVAAELAALEQMRRDVEIRSIELAMEAGDHRKVLPRLRAQTAGSPDDTIAARQLMVCLAATGSRAAALQHYDDLCRTLAARGEVPEPILRDLHSQLVSLEMVPTGSSPIEGNLGEDVTLFFGRSGQRRQLRSALSQHRLVSLIGPAGVGKSRLARECARESAANFPGGVWLAQLADVADGDDRHVGLRVSEAFGSASAAEPRVVETAKAACRNGPVLLILDNCEHVIDGAATLIVRLVEQVSNLTVLTTSRETLAVPGEHVSSVLPLASGTVHRAGPAVSLFLDRARATMPPNTTIDLDPIRVGSICNRLDGLPLAIEVAASQLGYTSFGELDQLIESGLDEPGIRSPHLRHATVGEAVRWSFFRQSDEVQTALMAASVFRGSFDVEGLAIVANQQPSTIVAAVSTLRRCSLLSADPSIGDRHRVLRHVAATVRMEAERRGALNDLRDRHLDYVAQLPSDPTSASLIGECGHGLYWAIASGRHDAGLQLLDNWRLALYQLHNPPAIDGWLAGLVDEVGPRRAIALELRLSLAFFRADYDTFLLVLEPTMDALRSADDGARLARALIVVALAHAASYQPKLAIEPLNEAAELIAKETDDWLNGWYQTALAYKHLCAGEFQLVEEPAGRAAAGHQRTNDRRGKIFVDYVLGRLAAARADLPRAQEAMTRGVQLAVEIDDHFLVSYGHLFLGRILLEHRQIAVSAHSFRASLVASMQAPNLLTVREALEGAAQVLRVADFNEAADDVEMASSLVGLGAADGTDPTMEAIHVAVDHLGAAWAIPSASV